MNNDNSNDNSDDNSDDKQSIIAGRRPSKKVDINQKSNIDEDILTASENICLLYTSDAADE